MPDLGAVVIPADIALAIATDEQSQGTLGGARLESESLYLITSARLSSGQKQTASLARLESHRNFQEGESSDDLLRWFRIGHDFAEAFRPWRANDRARLIAAIGYTLPDGIEYICTVEPTEKMPKVRAYCLLSKGNETHLFPLQVSVLYRADPYRRLPKDSVERLGEKKVAIVGVGSGGGELAVQLACAGVGGLLVFDGDRLEPANLIRHQLTRRDLGRRKVSGLRSSLAERDLPTKVTEYFTDVIEWADDFRSALSMGRPDLVICATDSRESRRFVNCCAVKLGIPLIIAGILDNGRIGEVLSCEPQRTACYECARLELGAALEPPDSDQRPAMPYIGGEGADLQSGTYRFDVSIVSGLATRAALHLLDPLMFERLPANFLVWGREKTPYEPPFRFEYPLSVNYVAMPKRVDCPVCGMPAPELRDVDIEVRAAEILAEIDEIPT